MPSFNVQDYVTVAQRLDQAKEQIQSITADRATMLDATQGFIRVKIDLVDGRSATGTASFRLDLAEMYQQLAAECKAAGQEYDAKQAAGKSKSAQATNPIEDAETSAVGRALAFLGFSSSRSIASREEVTEAQRRQNQRPAAVPVRR